MVKVSVIVPVYKVEKYLVQCLESIVTQTLKEIEILVVDEGDMDRCREIIDYFAARDPRIVAPHQKNGGYGASCNLGFDLAKGEYISIIESDDFIDPDMYERMYAYAKRLDADVVKTPYREYFSDGRSNDCPYRRYLSRNLPKGRVFSMKEFPHLLAVHASLWSGIYRTSYMREKNIRFIEAKGGAYVDVGFRIDTLINTDRVAWLDMPFYNYRLDNEGSTTNNFKLMPMLKRWSEQHHALAARQQDYDEHYGQYLILDEYLNTVGWLHNIDASKEEYELLAENLSYVPDQTIKTSPVLNRSQKGELLSFKRDWAKFGRGTRNFRIARSLWGRLRPVFEWLDNTTLLIWFSAASVSFLFARSSLPMRGALGGLCAAVGGAALAGVGLCCLGKMLRRALLFCEERIRKQQGADWHPW